jgi:Malectin domain/Common central domain of tyrosinase
MVRAMGALSAMLVAVVVAVAAAQNTLLVDCGSPTLDPDSRVTNAAGTQKIGGTSQVDLPNTSFDSRFRTQRELRAGQTSFAYTFTVTTSGDFSVVLSFAELRTNLCTAGARAFDIYANNRLVESRFDIASRAGGCNRALTRTLRVTVGADRRLVLRFQKSGNNQPTISAIEYTRLGNGPATPTPTPTPRPTPAATCDGLGIVTRKDIRDFSQTEWTNYVNAWKALGARASGKVQSGINLNAVEWLSQAHLESALHNQPLFLVWHRVMLWEFDKALHSVAPGVRQPYFDWSTASSNLFGSSIFGSSRYGGNGPVTGGSFAVLTSAVGSPGTRHTVVRNFNSGVQVVNRNTINGITATNTGFDTFRRALESAHNAFHNAVGGDMMVRHLNFLTLTFLSRQRGLTSIF